jgi:hypothetical protein
VRADALYARVLFLFLGLPGARLHQLSAAARHKKPEPTPKKSCCWQPTAMPRTLPPSHEKPLLHWQGQLILVGISVIGTLLGLGIAQILVTVLTGVFDPPPEHLFILWGYMAALAAAAMVATVGAIFAMKILSHRPVVEALRNM